jgi:hypothetical protein
MNENDKLLMQAAIATAIFVVGLHLGMKRQAAQRTAAPDAPQQDAMGWFTAFGANALRGSP